ncbi:MAG: hypothetical protein O7E57_08495 [Gammaproteobacteria bacterium]|nr:hypothetical protein [Gammaproteobacteria bacterium]
MDYVDVAEAKKISGLRLVLTKGVPGPWGEAAKAIFNHKNIPFVAVAQHGGAENPGLVAWTRHRNAPIALFEDEAPRTSWLEILLLAERLAPEPTLVPEDIETRRIMIGLANEICSEQGFAWNARLLMFKAMLEAQGDAATDNPMLSDYGYSPSSVAAAPDKMAAVLGTLTRQLTSQRESNSRYFVGKTLTAVDIYWAYFSQLIDALPPQQNSMPNYLRQMWGYAASGLRMTPDPILMEQRNFIYDEHLVLPLDF